jgi:hypothetical protein
VGALFIVSFLTVVSAALLWKVTDQATVEALPIGVNPEKAANLLDQMRLLRIASMALAPVTIWLKCAVTAAVLTIIAMIFSDVVPFKKLFALVTYAQITLALNMLVAAVATILKGSDAIRSPGDILINIGWSQFFAIDNQTIKALLDSLGIFNLWYFCILGTGLVVLCRTTRAKAAVAIVFYWALTAIVSIGLASLRSGQS